MRPPLLRAAFAAALSVLFALSPAAARGPAQTSEHGWSVTLHRPAGFDDPVDLQAELPAAAFALAAGETLHPLLPLRDWSATFDGRVRIEDSGAYRFGLICAGGTATVRVLDGDGAELARFDGSALGGWSDTLDLGGDEVHVRVDFERGDEETARLQLRWTRATDKTIGFEPEPLPSRFVRPAAEPRTADAAWRGRLALESQGCTNCHRPEPAARHAIGLRPGPDLSAVGTRLQPTWLLPWILNPTEQRPGAGMPDLFGESEADAADAEAVVHYLMSLAPEPAGSIPPIEGGRELYHRVGCVACHGPRLSPAELYGDEFLPDDLPDAPLVGLAGVELKWKREPLTRFLLDPTHVYPDGRMPSFGLSRREATALAAYLVPRELLPAFLVDPERARRGGAVFVERGCVECHATGTEPPQRRAQTALKALRPGRGCLDPADADTPRYGLDAEQRDELGAGIRALWLVTGVPAPHDAFARRVDHLGCVRCHSLDGGGGPADELDLYFVSEEEETDLGDEGRLPPDLSGAGFRLTTRWLGEVLTGEGRARPYLATRMPRYGAHVAGIDEAFGTQLGIPPHSDAREPEVDDKLAMLGRSLMDRTQLSCVACHVYKDRPPNGTVGADITRFAERLRYEWFRAFLPNPMRYKPGTRMPSFAGAGGASTLTTVLDGDLAAQVDALWGYFALGDFMPPPEGVSARRGLQLAVNERPRVLRTFLAEAGSRGIAVGFPAGVHFGFDAQGSRLVDAWRGDFLDASGAWAGRGGSVSGGTGPSLWKAPGGPPLFLIGEGEPELVGLADIDPRDLGYRFDGYRLEPDGAPVFEYSIARGDSSVRVEEALRPRLLPRVGFDRAVRLIDVPESTRILMRAGAAATLHDLVGAALDGQMEVQGERSFLLRPTAREVSFRVEVMP
ncbi:MAG: hypothetical protein AAF682_01730 [Planctomycetota bacterium]